MTEQAAAAAAAVAGMMGSGLDMIFLQQIQKVLEQRVESSRFEPSRRPIDCWLLSSLVFSSQNQ